MWELLLHEINKPGRQVRWEHVPAHVNVYGNKVANGLAVEETCSSTLWSRNVRQDSDSEYTVRLAEASDSNAAEIIW